MVIVDGALNFYERAGVVKIGDGNWVDNLQEIASCGCLTVSLLSNSGRIVKVKFSSVI